MILILLKGIFGYSINVLGDVMHEINRIEKSCNKEKEALLRFMHKKNLSLNLRIKLMDYIEYLHKADKKRPI